MPGRPKSDHRLKLEPYIGWVIRHTLLDDGTTVCRYYHTEMKMWTNQIKDIHAIVVREQDRCQSFQLRNVSLKLRGCVPVGTTNGKTYEFPAPLPGTIFAPPQQMFTQSAAAESAESAESVMTDAVVPQRLPLSAAHLTSNMQSGQPRSQKQQVQSTPFQTQKKQCKLSQMQFFQTQSMHDSPLRTSSNSVSIFVPNRGFTCPVHATVVIPSSIHKAVQYATMLADSALMSTNKFLLEYQRPSALHKYLTRRSESDHPSLHVQVFIGNVHMEELRSLLVRFRILRDAGCVHNFICWGKRKSSA